MEEGRVEPRREAEPLCPSLRLVVPEATAWASGLHELKIPEMLVVRFQVVTHPAWAS